MANDTLQSSAETDAPVLTSLSDVLVQQYNSAVSQVDGNPAALLEQIKTAIRQDVLAQGGNEAMARDAVTAFQEAIEYAALDGVIGGVALTAAFESTQQQVSNFTLRASEQSAADRVVQQLSAMGGDKDALEDALQEVAGGGSNGGANVGGEEFIASLSQGQSATSAAEAATQAAKAQEMVAEAGLSDTADPFLVGMARGGDAFAQQLNAAMAQGDLSQQALAEGLEALSEEGVGSQSVTDAIQQRAEEIAQVQEGLAVPISNADNAFSYLSNPSSETEEGLGSQDPSVLEALTQTAQSGLSPEQAFNNAIRDVESERAQQEAGSLPLTEAQKIALAAASGDDSSGLLSDVSQDPTRADALSEGLNQGLDAGQAQQAADSAVASRNSAVEAQKEPISAGDQVLAELAGGAVSEETQVRLQGEAGDAFVDQAAQGVGGDAALTASQETADVVAATRVQATEGVSADAGAVALASGNTEAAGNLQQAVADATGTTGAASPEPDVETPVASVTTESEQTVSVQGTAANTSADDTQANTVSSGLETVASADPVPMSEPVSDAPAAESDPTVSEVVVSQPATSAEPSTGSTQTEELPGDPQTEIAVVNPNLSPQGAAEPQGSAPSQVAEATPQDPTIGDNLPEEVPPEETPPEEMLSEEGQVASEPETQTAQTVDTVTDVPTDGVPLTDGLPGEGVAGEGIVETIQTASGADAGAGGGNTPGTDFPVDPTIDQPIDPLVDFPSDAEIDALQEIATAAGGNPGSAGATGNSGSSFGPQQSAFDVARSASSVLKTTPTSPVAPSGSTGNTQGAGASSTGSRDNTGSQDVTSTGGAADPAVPFFNSAPTAVGRVEAADENAVLVVDVAGDLNDVDGDVLSIISATLSANGPTPSPDIGRLEFLGTTLTFSPGSDFDSLAAGETSLLDIDYTVQDPSGATASATVSLTVTGSNDGPVALSVPSELTNDLTSLTVDLSPGIFDIDLTDTWSIDPGYTVVTDGTTALVEGVHYTLDALNKTFTVSGSQFQALPVGAFETLTLTYTARDTGNATVSNSVSVQVDGTNHVPKAVDSVATTSENTDVSIDVSSSVSDIDGDVLSITTASVSAVGPTPTAGVGSVSYSGTTLTFSPGTDFDGLASGESTTLAINYTVQDPSGASASATVTVTVTGTNDGPVAVALTNGQTDDLTDLTVNLAGSITDADLTDSWSIDAGYAVVTSGTTVLVEGVHYTVDQANKTFVVHGAQFTALPNGNSEIVTLTFSARDTANATVANSVAVQVDGTNQTPVLLTSAGSVTFVEKGSVVVDGSLSISDADVADLVGATVSISAGHEASVDVLTADTSGTALSTSFNAATGVLTVSGSGSVADYQQVLRTVTFSNPSDTPATTTRQVDFVVNDGLASSSVASRNISVTSVNEAPTLAAFEAGNPVAEFNGTDSGISIADYTITDSSTMSRGTIESWVYLNTNTDGTIYTNQDDFVQSATILRIGEDFLNPITPGTVWFQTHNNSARLVSNSTLNTGQWYHIAVTFDVTSASLYIDGALDSSVTGDFSLPTNLTSKSSPTIGAWDISGVIRESLDGKMGEFRIWETARTQAEIQATMNQSLTGTETGLRALYNFSGGVTSGGAVTDVANGYKATSHSVSSVDDPSFPLSGTTLVNPSVSTSEETSVLLPSFAVADTDGDALTVTVTGGNGGIIGINANGGTATIVTSNGGVTYTITGATADINLALQTLTYTPALDFAGSTTVTLTVDDGIAAPVTETVSVSVSNVQDAPVLSAASVTLLEDSPGHALQLSDFEAGFSDADTGDTLQAIRIDTLPANGTLYQNGVAVTAGQVIARADIGLLSFTPDANVNGATSFTWTATDGTSYAASSTTMTLNITAVSDAPTLVGVTDPGSFVRFDGVDDRIEIASPASAAINGTTPLTYEMWIRTDALTHQTLIDTANTGTDTPVFRMHTLSSGELSIYNAVGGVVETVGANVTTGAWTHVAFSFDGANAQILVNGVAQQLTSFSSSSVVSSDGLSVGYELGAATDGRVVIGDDTITGRNYDGDIADVRIWSVGRTEQEIANSMDTVLSNPEAEPNLFLNLTFEGAGGSSVQDTSANQFTASLTTDSGTGSGPVVLRELGDTISLANGQSGGTISQDVAINGSFSVEAFVRIPATHADSSANSGGILSHQQDVYYQPHFSMTVDASGFLVVTLVGGTNDAAAGVGDVKSYTTTTVVADGKDHHIAFTFDDTTDALTLYIDGQQQAVTVNSEWSGANTYVRTSSVDGYGLRFGTNEKNDTASRLEGDIGEVRVWNTALTAAAIAVNAANPVAANETGLQNLWTFEEGNLVDAVSNNAITLGTGASASQAVDVGLVRTELSLSQNEISEGSLKLSVDTGFSVSLSTGPVNGSVVVQSDGAFTYTPRQDFSGVDNFSVTLTDTATGDTRVETVAVTVNATPSVVDAPTALAVSAADYVKVTDSTNLFEPGTGSLTVETWFYWPGAANRSGLEYLLSHGNVSGSDDPGYSIFINNANTLTVRAALGAGDANKGETQIDISGLTEGWHHVAMVIDQSGTGTDGTVSGYLNGSSANWAPEPGYNATWTKGTFNSGTDSLVFGGRSDETGTDGYSGMLDDIRIWNTARSEADIAKTYGQELQGSETNLVGYWNFNDTGSGTVATDLTSNANNGSFMNSAGTQNLVQVQLANNDIYRGLLLGSDSDGDALSYSIVTGPDHGSVSLDGNTFVYDHVGDNMNDRFVVAISDGTDTVTEEIDITVV